MNIYEVAKDDERVVACDILTSIKTAKEAFDNLHGLLNGENRIKRWKSNDWIVNKANGELLVKDFNGAFRQMLHDRVTLVSADKQMKKSRQTHDRKLRDQVNAIKRKMNQDTTPAPFSAHIAKFVDMRGDRVYEAASAVPYESELYTSPEDLKDPRFFPKESNEDSTLHDACARGYSCHVSVLHAKSRKAEKKLSDTSKTHACYLLDAHHFLQR